MRRIVRVRGPKTGGAGKDDDNASGGTLRVICLEYVGMINERWGFQDSGQYDAINDQRGKRRRTGHREVRMMRQCRVVHID